MPNIATVFGATGMIGGELLKLLLKDPGYDLVRTVGRRTVGIIHAKLEEHVADLTDVRALEGIIAGSRAVFVAIGTTQRKVGGDLDAYRKVDVDIPVNAAKAAAAQRVQAFALVSAVGADPGSAYNFYLRLKGETEDTVIKQGVPGTLIFRPSLLMGDRMEWRPSERLAQLVMPVINPLLWGKQRRYRGISAVDVAKSMIQAVRIGQQGIVIHEYDAMTGLSKSFDA